MLLPVMLSVALPMFAQSPPLTWRHVGGLTLSQGLAGPAGGPVQAVWYADGGARLVVQTAGGRVFETSDFEHWRLNAGQLPGEALASVAQRQYAVRSDNIYASEDNGRSWVNVTGFNSRSVVGGNFHSIAVSPADPRQLTAANDYGVWRSLDGGLSWHGLNEDLPNLQPRRLLGRRKMAVENGTAFALEAGAWVPASVADAEPAVRVAAAQKTSLNVTASVRSGNVWYAGTADGRIAVSRDSWATSSLSTAAAGIAIDRIQADAERPDAALAIAGAHLFRTVNGGTFWDEVGTGLPAVAIHGVAADRSSSTVYVATERGLYSGVVSLNDAGPVNANWTLVSRDLPVAAVWDVRLNGDGSLTVALDGYGVFETAAPHRTRGVRIVNGADMSDRPAAPGSLISIIGANIARGRVGELNFPVLASAEDSSQMQVPFEAAAGSLRIALESATGRWSVPLAVREASPSIFIDSEGAPLLLDSSSGLVLDSKVAVRPGDSIQMLATGLGRVTPDWPSGVPAPLDSPPAVKAPVTAFLDGSPVEVTRATLAPGYVGYYIVELRVPQIVNRGAGELRLVMNGEESNRVRLYLESALAAR